MGGEGSAALAARADAQAFSGASWRSLAPWQIALSFAALSAPILLFAHPALCDYQNHLARIWLIANDMPGRPAVPFYSVDWGHITSDLGVDLAARLLGGVLTADQIGRLCLSAAVMLPPLGAILLNRRVFGGGNATQLLIPFFAWTLTVLAGFLNYQIGLGLALLFAALDPIFKARGAAVLMAARCLCGVILFLDHALALLFYSLLIGALTFGPTGPGAQPIGPRLVRSIAAAFSGFVPVLLLSLAYRVTPGNHHPAGAGLKYAWNTLSDTLLALTSPLVSYDLRIDAILAVLLAGAVLFALWKGKIRLHAGLVGLALVLLIIQPFLPSATPQGGWTDRRLPIMALLVLLSGVQATFPARRAAGLVFALAAFGLVILRTAWIGWSWQGAERLSDEVAAAMSAVPAGAAVLPVQHVASPAELAAAPRGRFIFHHEATYRHLQAMALPDHGAFVPTEFAQRGVHPIRLQSPWDQIANPEGGELASVDALSDARLIPANASYVRAWRSRFDYVLVLNADYPDRNGVAPPPGRLALVRDAGFAVLYRIVRR
ncbi:hypothetical protein [Phenylobacterium montanum]|uniref:Uncharacterized protein n=1 Tax=Phenylobacterium montanum TaxID=2823693 RepID=A0A975IVU9_9CAUL|nr:hypothetical protein [Caulobacter sp. S6]QUD88934.1 hypothetical protein KCG34_03325 [Caulobacter sp. S6]